MLANRPRLHATPLAAPGIHRTIALARRRGVGLTHAARALYDQILGRRRHGTAAGRRGAL